MKYAFSIPLFSGFSFLAFNAVAADLTGSKLGNFDVVPKLTIEHRYDSNILLQADNELDSWVTVVSPSISAKAEISDKNVELSYRHVAGYYESSSSDDFSDNYLSGTLNWEPSHRSQFELFASYIDNHEDRGSGFSEGTAATLIDEPDTLVTKAAGIRYGYGAIGSNGRLIFAFDHLSRRYTNHRSDTRGRDRKNNALGAVFDWKVGGRTSTFLEAEYTDINYVSDPAGMIGAFDTLDSVTQNYSIGVSWEATGKTKGSVKVGHVTKQFDDRDRENFSGENWEVNVQWKPRSYSVFTLLSSREARETNGVGNFIDEKSYSLSWRHNWNKRLMSVLYYRFDDERYGGDSSNREDELNSYGARVNYTAKPWLDLGVSASMRDKNSTIRSFSHERTRVALHVTMRL